MKLGFHRTKNEPVTEFFIPITTPTDFDFYYCDKCCVVFEKDDVVLQKMEGRDKTWLACPLRKKKKHWWFKKKSFVEACLNRLEGWNKSFFAEAHTTVDVNL